MNPTTAALYDANRLWFCRDLDVLFTGRDQVVAPWPRLPARKHGPKTPSAEHLFDHPPTLTRVDPRLLWSTQPWVLRHHVAYYLTGEWERTGRTSADQHTVANRYPLVVADAAGRPAILAGHHRAASALLEGRELWVRSIERGPVAVVPHLWIEADGANSGVIDIDAAVAAVKDGHVAVLASTAMARPVLQRLGLDALEIDDRVRITQINF